jgi:hypothetical protein
MSRLQAFACPICELPLAKAPGATAGDRAAIECARCGRFEVSGTAQAMLSAEHWTPVERATLSHAVRRAARGEPRYMVTSDLLDAVKKGAAKPPTQVQQSNNLLRYVADHVNTVGAPLERLWPSVIAEVGALNDNRLGALAKGLVEAGLLQGIDASSQDGIAFIELEPTLGGWEKVEADALGVASAVAAAQPPAPSPVLTRAAAPPAAGPEVVFIGYRRADTADAAGRVYDRLHARLGAGRVFKDVDSIPVGVDFSRHIHDVIQGCGVFLALIGPRWLEADQASGVRRIDDPADFVRLEIEAALATSTVRVVPVLINGAVLPAEDQLPVSLRPLRGLNCAVVRQDPDFHHDMDKLLRALGLDDAPQMATQQVDKKRAAMGVPGNSSASGSARFDYSAHGGRFVLGDGDWAFETKWSKASDKSIHIYDDPASIAGVAVARGATAFGDITDAAALDFSSRSRTPAIGDIVVLQNSNGYYAAIKVVAIADDKRGAAKDELAIDYVIQTNGSAQF